MASATADGKKRSSKRLQETAVPKENLVLLREIKEGLSIVVRRKPVADPFSWATVTALGVTVTDNETAVTVRFQPLPDDSRAAKNSGLILTDSVSTKNGAKIAILRHKSATRTCDFLPAKNVLGNLIGLQVLESNIYRSENKFGDDYVRYDGASPEECAAQNRLQPLLDKFSLHGSASCELGQVCPSLNQLMLLVDPSEQRLHFFTPTKEFIRVVEKVFTEHVPGQNRGVKVEKLVSPFVDSTDWAVIAIVLGPSMPSSSDDFDKVTAVAILLVNRNGVVLVPFTATNRARQREGVAHQFRNFFLLVRNFFRGSTNTPVITHVVAQSNCDYGYFAYRCNHGKLSANDLRTVISGDATFDTYARTLSIIPGIYLFACRDYITDNVRPMPEISLEDQSKIATQTIHSPKYIVRGQLAFRSSAASSVSRTAGSSTPAAAPVIPAAPSMALEGAGDSNGSPVVPAAPSMVLEGAGDSNGSPVVPAAPSMALEGAGDSNRSGGGTDARKRKRGSVMGVSEHSASLHRSAQMHSAGKHSLRQIEAMHGDTGLETSVLPDEYVKRAACYVAFYERQGIAFLALPSGRHNLRFGSSIVIHTLTKNARLTITSGQKGSEPLTYVRSVDHRDDFTIENESEGSTAVITVMKTHPVITPTAASSGHDTQLSSSQGLQVGSAAAHEHSAADSAAVLKEKVKCEIVDRYLDTNAPTEKKALKTILDALYRQQHDEHVVMNATVEVFARKRKTVNETIEALIKMAT